MSAPVPATRRRVAAAAAGALAAAAALTGCDADGGPIGGDDPVVALLVAGDEPRWEARDVPALEQAVARACADCEVVTRVGAEDAEAQADQLDEVLAEGADVVVVRTAPAAQGSAQGSASALLDAAGDVPVVAYDRPLPGADHQVVGDAAAVGRLQGRAVAAALEAGRGSRVLLLDGGGGDPGEAAHTRAVRRALGDVRAVRVLEPDAPAPGSGEGTSSLVAARTTTTAALRGGPLDAVVAATDVQAAGALAAVRAARPRTRPVVVGADADLDAVRRLVTGTQALTVWTDGEAMARRAGAVAAALATGEEVPPREGGDQVGGVPTDTFGAVPVTVREVARVLVRRDVVSIDEVCDAATRPACERAGLV